MRTKGAVPASSPRLARSPRPLAAAVAAGGLILIVTVAGCSGAASSSAALSGSSAAGAGAAPAAASAARAPAASGSVAAGSAASGATARYAPSGRQLIYTAQLTVRAGNVASAVARATSLVTAAGGYVSAESASAGQGRPGEATATVTFKIPVAGYDSTLAALSGGGLGSRLSLTQQAKDVTQQVADVSSRVTSDEAAIAQLRALLKRAGDVGALLSVQNQIDAQESDLESMLAQQSALDHETAYATVTLKLVGPAAPAAKSAPPPGLAAGLADGWRALRLTAGWLATIVGAVAPFAAAAAVAGGLAWWGRRRMAQRRRKPSA